MQLGRPWRNRRCGSPAPMPRAATTNSRSRSSSSRARTMRASTGQDSSEMTSTVGPMPVPAIEARTRRKITGGSVMARSTSRIAVPSTTRPPKLGDRADDEADHGGDGDRGDRDQQRDAAALEQPGEDVAAHAVAAEPVQRRGPLFMARRSIAFGP